MSVSLATTGCANHSPAWMMKIAVPVANTHDLVRVTGTGVRFPRKNSNLRTVTAVMNVMNGYSTLCAC